MRLSERELFLTRPSDGKPSLFVHFCESDFGFRVYPCSSVSIRGEQKVLKTELPDLGYSFSESRLSPAAN